jgi:hypothetical protein
MDLVTGDAPQPGETPRGESNPWAFVESDIAWWRADAERAPEGAANTGADGSRQSPAGPAPAGPAQGGRATTLPVPGGERRRYDGDAAQAHSAGIRDVTQELVAGRRKVKPADAAHDEAAAPQEVPDEQQPPLVPDVMILPEPSRNRPTVALERDPAPDRTNRTPPPPEDEGTPPSPLLETSPFWLSDAERAAQGPVLSEPRTQQRRRGRQRDPRRPATGLLGLVALGLLAAFFAWVSAEPFWLAVGHGDRGTATVARCTGDGVTRRCTGQFTAADGGYTVAKVALLGVEPGDPTPGAPVPARMVSRDSRQAYAGDTGLLVHLRWILGFALVLLCGLGIAGLTGAPRLETARARRGALIVSVAGPVLLLAGFLLAAY